MTDDKQFDFAKFPLVFNAVLDLAPTGPGWRARFAEAPGLDVRPVDEAGFLTVLHRGDVVMRIALSTFEVDAVAGSAQVMVDGAWLDVELRELPEDSEPPDTVPPEWLS